MLPIRIDVGHAVQCTGDLVSEQWARAHQMISAYEVFSPEPMPSNKIRS
jgi:hypothetical protein